MATGAASGIGRAACLAFAREGAAVLLTDINRDGGEETDALVRDAEGQAEFFSLDVSDAHQAEAAVARAVALFGRLDGAFNNVAMPERFTRFLDVSFDRLFAVNVRGVWQCMRAQIRQTRDQGDGGAIVNTSSSAGLRGAEAMAIYAATKLAVIGLSKSVALELARTGPRINAICPGVVDTPMMQSVASDARAKDAFLAAQSNGRFGRPGVVGEAAAWLLSDAASLVTGTHGYRWWRYRLTRHSCGKLSFMTPR